jgi:hypothetical protein
MCAITGIGARERIMDLDLSLVRILREENGFVLCVDKLILWGLFWRHRQED